MNQGNGKLPAGWRTGKLGDLIVEAATGFACGQRANDGAIQLRMNNVTRRGELDWSSFIRVPVEKAMLDDYSLRDGDVVFNNTNSTEMVGKTALFNNLKEPVVFSNHFTRLRTKPDALAPDFLALWLHAQWQAGLFARICDRWIGQSAVQRNKLLALEILLPPLEEQRRIAARLREQFSILAEARGALEVQLAAAESLPAANLRAVFEGKEAEHWPRRHIEDFAETASGTTPPRGNREYYQGRIPWVKTGELKDSVIEDTEEHVSEAALRDKSLKLLPEKTLLIAMYGQGQTRGRTGLLGIPATTNQACFAILPNRTFNPQFLQFWFQFSYQRLRNETERRGGNQPNLNGLILNRLSVPLPPIEQQDVIAAKLDAELNIVAELQGALRTKLAELEKIPAALMRAAFQSPS